MSVDRKKHLRMNTSFVRLFARILTVIQNCIYVLPHLHNKGEVNSFVYQSIRWKQQQKLKHFLPFLYGILTQKKAIVFRQNDSFFAASKMSE